MAEVLSAPRNAAPVKRLVRLGRGEVFMRLLRPFVAGVLAVLVFHQGALAMLYALGVTQRSTFVLTPTAPLGVPQVL